MVIAADFGHGLISRSTINTLATKSKFLAVNTQSNSANLGYNLITKYPRADYICIDGPEARLALSDRVSPPGDIAQRIAEDVDCRKIIITQGKHGCVTYEHGGVVHTIPAFAKNVVDTVGAGDSYSSGLLHVLQQEGVVERSRLGALDESVARRAMDFAARTAAITVSREGADPPWAEEMA